MINNYSESWRIPGGDVKNLSMAVIRSEHTLIAGTTGCGKSTLMNGIISDLLKAKSPEQAQLVLIDPKRLELGYLKDLPHVIRYTDEIPGAIAALTWCVSEMDRRYKLTQAKHLRRWDGADLYIIIDELHPLVMSEQRGEAWRLLSLLLTQGRASGIHVIAETQCPNRACLPNTVVPLFTTRIGMRCLSAIESRQVVGIKGCEMLPKHGRAIVQYDGELHNIRVGLTDYDELEMLCGYWKGSRCKA